MNTNRDKENAILDVSKSYDSFYLYDESIIIDSIKALKESFNGVEILYSLKTNPNKNVVKTIFNQGLGADAASLGEVLIASSNNVKKEDIFFSAPGKSEKAIEGALDKSIVIADSLDEIYRINNVAQKMNIHVEIGVRINPTFSFDSEVGAGSKFGVDEELLFENISKISTLENISIVGIHTHLRSQELNYKLLITYYKNIFKLAKRVEEKTNTKLKFINMGSGIGIPYSKEDIPLDVSTLGKNTLDIIKEYKNENKDVRILIESGRYISCKSGTYVTKVMDIKTSHNEKIAILNNTLNGFIRPSYEQLVLNYAGVDAKPMEPIYTRKKAFEIEVISEEEEREDITLYGNLCTSADIVGKNINLPKLKVGDMIAFSNAGSYSAVLSPMQFSSLIPPKELFYTIEGLIEE